MTTFSNKKGYALRILLQNPSKAWKLAALSEKSGISLRTTHDLCQALLSGGWAATNHQGLYINQPLSLLAAWAKAYSPPKARRLRLYSPNPLRLDAALQKVMPQAKKGQHLALASFSAARWWAPYVRQNMSYLYANEAGLGLLEELPLQTVPKGENVVVDVVGEEGVFIHQEQVIPFLFATSPLQTYLDLSKYGELGLEAAQHLLENTLLRRW